MSLIEKLSFEIPRDCRGRVNRYKLTDEMFEEICSLTTFIKDTSRKSLVERMYCLEQSLLEIPKCPECGGNVPWQIGNRSYSIYCSWKCAHNSESVKNKKKITCLERFNVENPFQSEEIKDSISQTKFERYGDKNFNNRDLFAVTMNERFGCSHALQNAILKGKSFQTKLERYGDGKYTNIDKRFETNISLYGGISPWCCEEVREKSFQTKSEKYGDGNFNNRNQAEQTFYERYGVKNNFGLDSVRIKISKTVFEKYGVSNVTELESVRNQISISLSNFYKAKRNADGNDYAGVVYFLYFPALHAVKIGLTSDLKSRSLALKRDFGEFTVIKSIETEECSKLESYMHEKFAEHRICLSEGSGRTEFFRDEILASDFFNQI